MTNDVLINDKTVDISGSIVAPEFDDKSSLGAIYFEKTRIKQLKDTLENILCNSKLNERIIDKLCTMCYEYNINYRSVKELLIALGKNGNEHDLIYTNYVEYALTSTIYEIVENSGQSREFKKRYCTQLEQRINNILVLSDISIKPSVQITSNTDISLNKKECTVDLVRYKDAERKMVTSVDTILNICPVKVVEYRDPENIEYREYEITFVSPDELPVTIPKTTLLHVHEWIKNIGASYNKNQTTNALNGSLQALKQASKNSKNHHEYIIEEKPLTCGFHYLNGKISCEDYIIKTVTPEQLKQGIQTLQEYATYFNSEEQDILGTVFKWGLYAPFIYCAKQVGQMIPWLYLQGKGSTGKSTGYARMVGYMWYSKVDDNFTYSQGRADTKARLGAALGHSTFPICINESEYIFEQKNSMAEFLKACVEQTIIRETKGPDGRLYKGLSAAICTSNGFITDTSGGITRRLLRLNFNKKMVKTVEEKKHFNTKWMMGTEDSPLTNLMYISHTFAKMLMEQPELIKHDYQEVVDTLLFNIFNSAGMDMPEWLCGWQVDCDGLEDMFNDEQEAVKEGFQRVINEKRRLITIKSEDDEYLKLDSVEMNDPREYVLEVLKTNMIEGLYLVKQEEVHITRHFIHNFFKREVLEHDMGVKEFSENFHWRRKKQGRYSQVLENKKGTASCFLYYDEFIEFVYGHQLMY